MSSDLVATFVYPCPHCRVELDAPASGWDGWMRCPSCERAFLPPEVEKRPRGISPAAVSAPLDGAASPGVAGESAMGQPLGGRLAHTSPMRLVFTTGFVLCAFLALINFLDLRPMRLAIFGFLAIGFFLLLMRTPGRRVPPGSVT